MRADSLKSNRILKGTTIWRAISLENNQNGVLFNSNNRCTDIGLFEIIKFGLFEKKLNAFSSDDFNEVAYTRLSQQKLMRLINFKDSSETLSFDADGNSKTEKVRIDRYLMGADIKGYLIKEDWVFNSYTAKTEKYLIGLAPLVFDKKQEKIIPLFWLYYPEWDEILALFEAQNFYSYERISYRDVFIKRYFVSVISKENNVFDRGLRTYKRGQDAYLESEQVKEKSIDLEQSIFQY